MPGRKYLSVTLSSAEGYRYGFNGKEKDKDINSLMAYDYGFRIYNPAIGKFLSEDPLTKKYPELTPYQFASNSPIEAVDVDGLESSAYRPLGQLAPPENAYKSGSESVNQKPAIDRKAELVVAPREQPAFRASTNVTSNTPASKPKTWKEDMKEAQDAWDATIGTQLKQEQVDAVENSPTKIFPVIGNLKTAGKYELMGMHKQAVGALKDAGVEVAVGYGVGKVFSLGSKLINTTKGVASPTGNFYSVAFEMELSPASYPGVTRYLHFREANVALNAAMETNPLLSQLGINVPKSASGSIVGKSPTDWVWHHNVNKGLMQLVPKSQHPNIPGGIFWEKMHPGGIGGFSIWGK